MKNELDVIRENLVAPYLGMSLPQILEDCKTSGYKILEVGQYYDKSYREVEPSFLGKYAVVGFDSIDDMLVFRHKGEAINAVVGKEGMPYVQIEEQFELRKRKKRKPKEKSKWSKKLKELDPYAKTGKYSFAGKIPFSYKLFMYISGEYKRVKDLHPYDLLNYAHEMREEGRIEKAGLFMSDLKTLNDSCPEDGVLLVKMDKFEPSWIPVQKRMMGFKANGYMYQIGIIFSSKTKDDDIWIKLNRIVSDEE